MILFELMLCEMVLDAVLQLSWHFSQKNQNWCCNCQKIQGPRHETFLQKILGPNMFCALFIQIDYSLPTRENACWWVELINLVGPVIQGKTTETKPTQIRADPPHQNRYRFLVLFIYWDVIWPMWNESFPVKEKIIFFFSKRFPPACFTLLYWLLC